MFKTFYIFIILKINIIYAINKDSNDTIGPIAKTCIVMPEEINSCKMCEHSKYNSGLFKYSPSRTYCKIKYELNHEQISCPYGWQEFTNYRNIKYLPNYNFKCSSQKVCCLYD